MKNQLLVFVWMAFSMSVNGATNWDGAQWIWQSEDGPANSWVSFRKTVHLDAVPANTLAKIAVDSKFWLWINGEMVVFEGGVSRGPSPAVPVEDWDRDNNIKPTNSWYDEVDISTYLQEGENTFALLVWYWGRQTHKGTHIDSKKGGLLFHCELDGDDKIVSDASWKMKQHPGYDEESGDNGTSIVQYNVKYDARNDLGDWSSYAWYNSDYDDSGWPTAIEKGPAGSAPWYDLEINYVPRLLNHGLQDYVNHSALNFPFISDGNPIVCHLPFNKQITPYFEIESSAGEVIEINTDNRLNRISANYTSKAGDQSFESFSWMNGQSVIYTIPAGITVKALKYRWMSVGEMAGAFSVSDPFYDRLWWMGRNTLFVCARDNFMDCPDRERALWIGDVADQTGYLFYSMDEAGRQLLKKDIFTTVNFSENNVIGGLGPGRVRELPAQSLQFIAQVVWPYYFNTGDRATLEAVYPYVYNYLALWKMDANDLPKYRKWESPDNWDWVDWGVEGTIDKTPIQFALYYMALEGAKNMADVLGEDAHVTWYEDRMTSTRAAFNQIYWKDGFYSSDETKFKDDRLNALAILSGMADREKMVPIVHNVLVPNRFASPHFEWMAEAAMCEAGKYSEALGRMKTQYQSQVDTEGQSTLYENFPKGGSYNHAWNASNTILSRYIAGIEPTKVAWTEFQVCPNLEHLTSLTSTIPSVQGNIIVEMSRSEERYILDLEVPDGTEAIVGIPKFQFDVHQVKVGDVLIWDDGTFIEGAEGVSWYGEENDFIKFKLSPGQWHVLADGTTVSLPQEPFTGTPIEIPGKFEAEDYDLGGEGVAYHDTDDFNQGGEYRLDGVDIGTGGSGFVVAHTNAGEWLEYTIDVAEDGDYDVDVFYASGRPGGGAKIGFSLPDTDTDTDLISSFELPVTWGWTDYRLLTIGKMALAKGRQVLRLNIIDRGFNLDWVELRKATNVGLENEMVNSFEVYPNPSSSGRFNLSEYHQWEVYSLMGNRILKGEGYLIDLSFFCQGIYFLKTKNSSFKLLYL